MELKVDLEVGWVQLNIKQIPTKVSLATYLPTYVYKHIVNLLKKQTQYLSN